MGWMHLIALAWVASTGGSTGDTWERLGARDGITVWRHELPDSKFLEFRAVTRIEAPLLQLVAVIFDGNRNPEWLEGNDTSFDIEHLAKTSVVNYSHTVSPFFLIADRDVVLSVSLTRVPQQRRLVCRFHSIDYPPRPPLPGVVRMTNVHGEFVVDQLSAGESLVTYQVFSDPGGMLPSWVVNWASQDMPLNTLAALKKQVKKAGYEALQQELRAAMDWSGFEL